MVLIISCQLKLSLTSCVSCDFEIYAGKLVLSHSHHHHLDLQVPAHKMFQALALTIGFQATQTQQENKEAISNN